MLAANIVAAAWPWPWPWPPTVRAGGHNIGGQHPYYLEFHMIFFGIPNFFLLFFGIQYDFFGIPIFF